MDIQELKATFTPTQLDTYNRILSNLPNVKQWQFIEMLQTYEVCFFQDVLKIELQDAYYLRVPYSKIEYGLFFTVFNIIQNILKNKQRTSLLYNLVNGYDLYEAPRIETYSIVQELPMDYVMKLNEIFEWFSDTNAFRSHYGQGYDVDVEGGEFGFFFEYACDTSIEFPFDMSNLELLDRQILWFDLMHEQALKIAFMEELIWK